VSAVAVAVGHVLSISFRAAVDRKADRGHPALLGLVVYGLEQAAVKGDVDPPRGSTVQEEWDQHEVGAAPPLGEVRIGLDGIDRAGRGIGVPSWRSPSTWNARASLPSLTASSTVSPTETQPGKSGKLTPYPMSSG